ncbi:NERD domain-containing protein [Alkalihalobacillus sp. MEB130]|uniref:nuclease-related domain-containing protein n=1 Tax=Alkalihalobacillus sp. MEB130 TaxID=2976704 RepID=UPI0028DF4655|nr:nuclease-related domain-containing protein [Alkalihalobacillus sp. MEB130]MDT8861958.1 NERD domain-containing protein [Alkalihalobacillus sp. MEB130]
MIIKPRQELTELKILRSLHARMKFEAKEESYYQNLERGFAGELKFDEWLEPISADSIIITDLLLEWNNTVFQIDTLLLSSNTIYLFEVKNYEGDFYIDSDQWYSFSKTEIKNPLLQVKRSESLLRRLLHSLGIHDPIEPYLIFINPDFYLYQTPIDAPIVFPTQLKRFINKLKKTPSHISQSNVKLAEKLLSLQLDDTLFMRLPSYDYEGLRKGILCPGCLGVYDVFYNQKTLHCSKCGCHEHYIGAVLRSITEYKLLFPNKRITTRCIHDWCNIIQSKRTIQSILRDNFKLVGRSTASHYINEK